MVKKNKKVVSEKGEKDVSPKITRGATPDVGASEPAPTPEPAPEKLTPKEGKETGASESASSGDYLRQYQAKKVSGVLTLGGVLTDPDKGSKAERMKAHLLGQKKVSTLIPLDPGSSSKVPYSVTLNGYRLDLPTNTYINIPEQVAEVVRSSNDQTVAALNQFKVDGDKVKEENL